MKVIVAGSRTFGKHDCDATQLEAKMDKLASEVEITEIVSGTAKGADKMGEDWAFSRMIKRVVRFHPDWEKHGKAAGVLRNQEMADYADMAVVFWDGVSRGSSNMIDEMKKRKKRVDVVMFGVVPTSTKK